VLVVLLLHDARSMGIAKMKHLSFRLLIAVITFTLGIAASTLWAMNYFSLINKPVMLASSEPQPLTQMAGDIPTGWRKVDMEGNASFDIPPGLKEERMDLSSLYRSFRNESMKIVALYNRRGAGATCTVQNDEKAVPRSELSPTTVGGRAATIDYLEKTTFDIDDATATFKGMIICVPDVGDGKHEFAVIAKYKEEQDYQNVRRVIDSIKFSQLQR
jgi:hypothetical protein